MELQRLPTLDRCILGELEERRAAELIGCQMDALEQLLESRRTYIVSVMGEVHELKVDAATAADRFGSHWDTNIVDKTLSVLRLTESFALEHCITLPYSIAENLFNSSNHAGGGRKTRRPRRITRPLVSRNCAR